MEGPGLIDDDDDLAPEQRCGCRLCLRFIDTVNPRPGFPREVTRMILCNKCGNKRCPHATDHRYACTGSNEPGQPGSSY